MKKFILVLSAMVVLMNSIVVNAQQENPITLSATEVLVNQETGEFEFDILINESEAYAGMEFGMVCGPECEILSIEYDKDVSTTGPAENDLTWFGFFDGEDSFTESITAKVIGTCQTGVDSAMALKTVKKYTIGSGEYKEEEFFVDSQINLVTKLTEEQSNQIASVDEGINKFWIIILGIIGVAGITGLLIYKGVKSKRKVVETRNASIN